RHPVHAVPLVGCGTRELGHRPHAGPGVADAVVQGLRRPIGEGRMSAARAFDRPYDRARAPVTVVVGNGMAGARLAVELRERDPQHRIVVFGAEPCRAYNRILLSEVLAGSVDDDTISLAEPFGAIDLRTGVTVT